MDQKSGKFVLVVEGYEEILVAEQKRLDSLKNAFENAPVKGGRGYEAQEQAYKNQERRVKHLKNLHKSNPQGQRTEPRPTLAVGESFHVGETICHVEKIKLDGRLRANTCGLVVTPGISVVEIKGVFFRVVWTTETSTGFKMLNRQELDAWKNGKRTWQRTLTEKDVEDMSNKNFNKIVDKAISSISKSINNDKIKQGSKRWYRMIKNRKASDYSNNALERKLRRENKKLSKSLKQSSRVFHKKLNEIDPS